jgi:hypothetical protein
MGRFRNMAVQQLAGTLEEKSGTKIGHIARKQ